MLAPRLPTALDLTIRPPRPFKDRLSLSRDRHVARPGVARARVAPIATPGVHRHRRDHERAFRSVRSADAGARAGALAGAHALSARAVAVVHAEAGAVVGAAGGRGRERRRARVGPDGPAAVDPRGSVTAPAS